MMQPLSNHHLAAHRSVLQYRVRPDAAFLPHLGFTQQLHKGLDHGVRSHRHPGIDHRGLRAKDRYPFCHQPARGHESEFAIDRHHLFDRVGPQHFIGILGLQRYHPFAGFF